jgi:hypothetical protein
MRAIIAAAMGCVLCGCAPKSSPTSADIQAAQLSEIENAKRDCAQRFPITPNHNHAAWARCYVDFYNANILPSFPYPDLANAVTAKRVALAEKVDAGQITEAEADAELAQTRAWAVGEAQRRANGAMQTQAQMAAARAAYMRAFSPAPAMVVQPPCSIMIGGRCQ